VFFDELGPPWPKHPCTNNKSIPGRLRIFSGSVIPREWQTAGWEPFFILGVVTAYKFVLEIKGVFEGQSVTIFVRKNAHTAITQISKQSIAFLRKRNDGCFDLSLLTVSGVQITAPAFPTLIRAGETMVISSKKRVTKKSAKSDGHNKKRVIKKSAKSDGHNKAIQAPLASAIALAFAEAEKNRNY
jgi:hypothetical protein